MDYKAKAEAALRERAEIFEKRKALFESDKTDAEKREQVERMDADMDRLAAEARSFVEEGEREAELRDLMGRAGKLSNPTPGQSGSDNGSDFRDQLRSILTGPIGPSLDIAASGKVDAVARRSREIRQSGMETRTTGPATSANAAWVGDSVPETFVANLLESLYKTSEVVSRVRNITTGAGEPMNWPRLTSRPGGAFTPVAEGAQYGDSNNGALEQFTLSAHKFGALTQITYEAATDSELNIEQMISSDIGETLAFDLAGAVWNGNGTNGPVGLLNAPVLTIPASTGTTKAKTDDGTADGVVSFVDLIDLQHKVIAPYRRNSAFYMNDDTSRQVRHLVDGQGRYLWQPAVIAGAPDMLLGNPAFSDYQVPALPTATATNVPGIVFGDLNRAYVLRTVRRLTVVRSLEYGFDKDLITLKTTWRGDGNVTDVNAYAVLTFSHA